jgi:nucleotide-binding universal stress UspA family protein
MQTLRHLVSGTDFSECAERALALAIELAVCASAQLTLVHVCELGIDDRDDLRLAQCGEALSALVALHRSRGVQLTGVLRCGKPWTKLDNVAAEVGASLIVIGRHGADRGRSGALGSVADCLLRTASRPVLSVPFDFDRPDAGADETKRSFRKQKTT